MIYELWKKIGMSSKRFDGLYLYQFHLYSFISKLFNVRGRLIEDYRKEQKNKTKVENLVS